MANSCSAYFSKRRRRRRIWFRAKIDAFVLRRSARDESVNELAEAASSGGRPRPRRAAASDLVANRCGVNFSGVECACVEAVVDVGTMWQRLEGLAAAAPRLNENMDVAQLAKAVPLLLKDSAAAGVRRVGAASLLSCGTASPLGHSGVSEAKLGTSQASFVIRRDVRIRRGKHGRGFFAENDLPAGTTILVERPVAAALDVQTQREKVWADLPGADTNALALQIAAKLAGPRGNELAYLMAGLHPAEGTAIRVCAAPDREEEEDEDDLALFAKMDSDLKAAFAVCPNSESVSERIPAVARLNGLGFYTNSEQLCYSSTYQQFTGTGLCLLASAFNHSCAPNVSRFAIADVLFFRTNATVNAGDELTISYIESETLCEQFAFRGLSLNRDFDCSCPRCCEERSSRHVSQRTAQEEDLQFLAVDSELQAEFAAMPPQQRVNICESLLRGELPAELQDEGDADEAKGKVSLRFKDAQELRAVLGVAHLQGGGFANAWSVWVKSARLVAAKCPPFDEALGVYAVQAAICAAMVESDGGQWSLRHLRAAAALHRTCFGGEAPGDPTGTAFFTRRYGHEVRLVVDLLPGRSAKSAVQKLWASLEQEKLISDVGSLTSWPELKDEVLSWRLPREKPSTTVARSGDEAGSRSKRRRRSEADLNLADDIIKPQAQIVNGLRVLP